MGSHDKTFNTICRVCLNHDKAEKMVSLTYNSDENGLSPYGISFERFTKISVKQNEYLPTKICHKCKKSLEKAATFMIRSEASDIKLEKLINFSMKQDLSGEMVKEVVRQYTLFNQNFPEDSKPSSSQPSTSHNDQDTLVLLEEPVTKSERKYSNIKVEIDVQQISPDSDSDDNQNNTTKNMSQSDYDNVDIFLYSIEKLVTTSLEDVGIQFTEVTPKKDLIQKNPEKIELDLTCPVCHRVLANPATYKNHIQRHGICRYICEQCGKSFPVRAELTQHQIYRHGIGSTLECDQCSFKAVRKLELIEHIRLHTGERPFTCEKCGLTFRRKAIYKTHLKSHGERTVSCDHCPRKFFRRSEMLSHANNIHDRVYVFLCKICNVTYAMAKTVRRHMLVHHGIPRNLQGKVTRVNKTSTGTTTDSNFFKESNDGGDGRTVEESELTDL